MKKKIAICTTPIRPYPTDFPPFGSMAIIQSIRRNLEVDVSFYNIDFHRPSLEEVRQYFKEEQFDVLGISAVVSTAYAYVKELTSIIKSVSPKTTIILGGNLAASAEILHRKCGVDYCVVGDGEKIIVELLDYLFFKNKELVKIDSIPGITFLNGSEFRFTGYGDKPTSDEIELPDYGILEKDGSIDYFISTSVNERLFAFDGNVEEGARVATLVMTKGCVARCTFCHRWEKGLRTLPIDNIKRHVDEIIFKYNVRFIQLADENFGSDKNASIEFANFMSDRNLHWQVGGVRTSTVTKEMLKLWRDKGCMSVYYGIESGSSKILSVMEKKTTVQQNIQALQWTGEVGLNTIIQLIIGMPGEDDQTIEETFEFLKIVAPHIRQWEGRTASDLISINYAQALPGTPLYEYGRENGLIGGSIDDEELYLLAISDTDAYKDDHFVNMTNQPLLKVLCWRRLLLARLDDFHYRMMVNEPIRMSIFNIIAYFIGVLVNRVKKKLLAYRSVHFAGDIKRDFVKDSGYFNVNDGLKFSPLLLNPITSKLLFPVVACYILFSQLSKRPMFAFRIFAEYWAMKFGWIKPRVLSQSISLRKVIRINSDKNIQLDNKLNDQMIELRLGR